MAQHDASSPDSERTPLLHSRISDDETNLNDSATTPSEHTPLPWRQIIPILLLNAAQPLSYELVFPFINQMLVELHVVDDPEKVGFYSGLIESIFSVTSLLTIMPVSWASDHFGRKPILLWGISCMALSVACFGMARSFWALVLARCIAGGAGGVWATARIMLGELSDKSNQAQAFAGLMVSYRIGQIVGLPIGGFFAHPERHWPGGVFESDFWQRYPFALPCFVGAGFAALAVLAGSFFLEETRLVSGDHTTTEVAVHTDESGNVIPEPVSSPAGASSTTATRGKKVSMMSVLKNKTIAALLLSNLMMCIGSECMFVIYPLWAFTPIESGGLSYSESQIGLTLSIRAVVQIGITFCYPYFHSHRWFGRGSAVRLYKLAMWIWPISLGFYPLMNVVARMREAHGVPSGLIMQWDLGTFVMRWSVEIIMGVFFLVWGFGGYCWTTSSVMTNDATPSAEALATVNGVMQLTIVIPQAITPAFATALFAYSTEHNLLNGYMHWVIMSAITTLGALQALALKEPEHDWRSSRTKKAGARE
ncbi:MFS general substrate transporter [Clavulina sp. PMI_390]|nr:MFS general substrate transporter [Clavulina sp. PMI_390]